MHAFHLELDSLSLEKVSTYRTCGTLDGFRISFFSISLLVVNASACVKLWKICDMKYFVPSTCAQTEKKTYGLASFCDTADGFCDKLTFEFPIPAVNECACDKLVIVPITD